MVFVKSNFLALNNNGVAKFMFYYHKINITKDILLLSNEVKD